MKVCTDSIILGCLADATNAERILDVGTGTGVLALIMADKTKAHIDAIEIVKEAAKQAGQNVIENHMESRIRVITGDFRTYCPENKYDLIIANPPYYSSGPDIPDQSRRISRYTEELTHSEFFRKSSELLTQDGTVAVCLPRSAQNMTTKLIAENNLHLNRIVNVRNTPDREFYLSVMFSSLKKPSSTPLIQELTIRDGNGNYTGAFRELTGDLYLSPEQKKVLKNLR